MTEYRIYSDQEIEFLEGHPDVHFEGVDAVWYRVTPNVTTVADVERFIIYPILKRN